MRVKDNLVKIGKSILLLVGLNALFYLFLVLAFMIPAQGKIKENVGLSLYTWQNESVSPILDNSKSYWLDQGSDMIFANIAVNYTENPFRAAITMPWETGNYQGDGEPMYYNLIQALYYQDGEETYHMEYSKHWKLIVGMIRIMFLVWQIKEIRYFFYFLIFALTMILLYYINKKLGWQGVLPLCVAMASRVWLMQSLCLTTMTDILIALLSMLFVVRFYEKEWYKKNEELFFLLIGAFAFSIGFFIAPLLTLGFPLILKIVLTCKSDKDKKAWWNIIKCSVAWLFGFGGSMAIKAVLAKAVSGMSDGAESALYYLGLEHGLKDRIQRIWYCFEGALTPFSVKGIFLAAILAFLIYMLCRNGRKKCGYSLQLLFIALYPIGWIFVIYEHSQHYWVANIISIFVYALFTLFVSHIGEKKNNEGKDPV